ncbi:MAG: hypothetical protein ACUVUD_06365 [bacterium]
MAVEHNSHNQAVVEALVEITALVEVLIDKGVFTAEEFQNKIGEIIDRFSTPGDPAEE